MRFPLLRLLATAGFVTLNCATIEARDLYGSYHQADVDFSLIADRAQYTLVDNSDDTSIITNVTRIGILAYNVPPATILHWGIMGGYAIFRQDAHNELPALEYSGSYLGLSARVIAYESQRINLTWTTNYSYVSLTDSIEEQDISLTWNQLDTNLQFGLYIARQYELVTGISYGVIENKQTESGAISESHNLENEDTIGFELSLLYHTHKHDFVGLRLKSGLSKGIGVQFQGTF